MKSLKIQDVSADCPSYIEEKKTGLTTVDEKAEGGKNKKIRKEKKRKMRKIRKKKRNPLAAVFFFLLTLRAFHKLPAFRGTI